MTNHFNPFSLYFLAITGNDSGFSEGGMQESLILLNPFDGTSGALFGGLSLNSLPSGVFKVSLSGLNDSLPPSAMATTSSGLPMKLIVSRLPSFRPGKFLLYDVTMVFGSPGLSSGLFHCPMQGPQAFANTVAPMLVRISIWPSRSIVALICSDPGVTRSGIFTFIPLDLAWSATFAALVMSS